LQGKPVAAGEPLLTCFNPDGQWNLQLHISDFRVGTVNEAIEAGESVRVRFSLSSHPDQLHHASLTKLSSHAIPATTGVGSESRVVLAEAKLVNPKALPIKMDGAIARATIDCGRVPAIWLVVHDAYRAVSSRVQMIW